MSTPDYKDEIPEGEDAAETPKTRTVADDKQGLQLDDKQPDDDKKGLQLDNKLLDDKLLDDKQRWQEAFEILANNRIM